MGRLNTILNAVNLDGWANVITGLGTGRDKSTGGTLVAAVPNTDYTKFQNLFYTDDLAATAAELPAREMVRAWISVVANDPGTLDDNGRQGSPDGEVSTEEVVSLGNKILSRLEELGAQTAVFESIVWSRVFGGSLLFMEIDDGGGDDPDSLAQPLNEATIQSFSGLVVYDRFEVRVAKRYGVSVSLTKLGTPEIYEIIPSAQSSGSPPVLVHETRFIRFDGVLTNRRRMRDNDGWSDSIYGRTEHLLRDYGQSWLGIANMIQDFAQAVFKIKGLAAALASDQDDLVMKRVKILDMCRSVARAVPLDADGEEFERKQTPVSGLADLVDRFSIRLAAAFRMPVTLLFGQSPAGQNATGESDISFFYDQISANQETSLRPKLERLIRLLLLSKDGPTNGVEPEDWSFVFNALFQLTELEQATLRKTQAETDKTYIDSGVLDEDEITFSRFGGDKYSTDTQLDLERRATDDLADDLPEDDPLTQPPPVVQVIPTEPPAE